MGIFADLTVKENMVLAARGAPARRRSTARGWPGSSAVPGGGEVLEPPGGQAVGRAKADAGRGRAIVEPRELLIVDEPSKGLAPGHHQQHDRRLPQLKQPAA